MKNYDKSCHNRLGFSRLRNKSKKIKSRLIAVSGLGKYRLIPENPGNQGRLLRHNNISLGSLFRFIDWIIKLPKPLASEFWTELNTYEESRKMPYITSVEKIGFERGKQEGKQEVAVNLLRQGLTIATIAQATGLSAQTLQQIQADLQANPIDGTSTN